MATNRIRRLQATWSVLLIGMIGGCASLQPGTPGHLDSAEAGYEVKEALQLGSLIQAAYVIYSNSPQDDNPDYPKDFPAGYQPFANLQGKDKPGGEHREFYGHLSRVTGQTGTIVISIRGTSNIEEWLDDAKFLMRQYPPDPDAGKVELGFNEIFTSFMVSTPESDSNTPLADFLAAQQNLENIIVTGHSLGSSLATLVAFDIGVKDYADQVTLLTFASPRTGNGTFVNSLENQIKKNIRLVNNPDIVPKVPPRLFGYRHVSNKITIDSHDYPNIKRSLVCYHSLLTYLHILDSSIKLEHGCRL